MMLLRFDGMTRLRLATALTIAGLAAASCSKGPHPQLALTRTVSVESVTAVETSGIAASSLAADVFWIHNDSSGAPVLLAVDLRGKIRGSLRVSGVKNIDWEDVSSFQLDGRAWLLIADVGDNNDARRNGAVYIVPEPDPAELSPERESIVSVAWTLPVRFPDGPVDCEAVAVDAHEETIYFLTKRTRPARLFTLPLRPTRDGAPKELKMVSSVRHLPQPDATQRVLPVPTGRYRGQPTALAFSPDRRMAVVLTYGTLACFPRRPADSWAQALARKPETVVEHPLPQAEGACFTHDGRTLLVTGEQKEPALFFYKFVR